MEDALVVAAGIGAGLGIWLATDGIGRIRKAEAEAAKRAALMRVNGGVILIGFCLFAIASLAG